MFNHYNILIQNINKSKGVHESPLKSRINCLIVYTDPRLCVKVIVGTTGNTFIIFYIEQGQRGRARNACIAGSIIEGRRRGTDLSAID